MAAQGQCKSPLIQLKNSLNHHGEGKLQYRQVESHHWSLQMGAHGHQERLRGQHHPHQVTTALRIALEILPPSPMLKAGLRTHGLKRAKMTNGGAWLRLKEKTGVKESGQLTVPCPYPGGGVPGQT